MTKRSVIFRLFITLFIITNLFIPKSSDAFPVKTGARKVCQKLSLYNYLDLLQKLTIEQDDLSEEDKKNIDSRKNALLLMTNITKNFKNGVLFYNPDVEYHFFEICDYFDQPDEIRLRHMRRLKNKVSKFREKLEKYLKTRKNFLRASDLKLLNDIQLFNELLINRLLSDNFLDTGFTDELADLFFYRPFEFVGKYKELAVSGAVITAGVLFYFIIYPIMDGFIEDWRLSKNKSKKHDVKQFKADIQSGAECGYHALVNALIFESSNDEEIVKKRLKKKDVGGDSLKKLKKEIADKRTRDRGDIDTLGDLSLKDKIAVIVAEKKEAEGDGWFFNLGVKSEAEGCVMIARQFGHRIKMKGDQWLNGGEIEFIRDRQGGQLKEKLEIDAGAGNILVLEEHEVGMRNKPARLQASIDRFKADGEAQSFVVRSGLHWIAAKIIRDPTAKKGVNAWVANSMRSNITDDKNLEAVVDLYAMQDA